MEDKCFTTSQGNMHWMLPTGDPLAASHKPHYRPVYKAPRQEPRQESVDIGFQGVNLIHMQLYPMCVHPLAGHLPPTRGLAPGSGLRFNAMSAQDKTDLSLALAAFAATAALLGPIAAAIAAAFIFGLLIGQGRTHR